MTQRPHARRAIPKLALAFLAATMLSGCVVGPDYAKPTLAVPAKWSGATGAAESPPVLARWWTRLDDPVLDALVERAVAGDLGVASAQARVREARATLAQEEGALLPTLTGGASVNRARTAAGDAVAASSATQFRNGFDAGWELDLFGGKARTVEAARYGLDAAEEDLRDTMLVLIGDVASNYAQVRAGQARLALSQRTARSQRQSASLIRARYESGGGSVADVSRAEALASTTEADVSVVRIAVTAATNRIGVLTGRAPASVAGDLARSRPIPRLPRSIPVGIPADTLSSRPDVRMAERRLAEATARIGAAEAARYPSITLTGNIATQALSLGDIGRTSSIGWAIGPSLNVPLFRGGQLRAAVEVTQARRDQSAAAYQRAVLVAMEEVENAVVALSQQRERAGKLAAAVAAYRRANEASVAQYEAGSLAYLDLLDTQRQLYAAEREQIDTRLAVVEAFIALQKALGGGWSLAPPPGRIPRRRLGPAPPRTSPLPRRADRLTARKRFRRRANLLEFPCSHPFSAGSCWQPSSRRSSR